VKVAALLQLGLFDIVERATGLADAYAGRSDDPFALLRPGIRDVADQARALEEAGFDGVYAFEHRHDVFFPLVLAAQATSLEVFTNVAVALPRSPLHLATQAYDLHLLSEGRFLLGLGTQVKPVIERRYSSTWSQPVERMRDLVLAIKAIWRCWQEGEPLAHDGPFYRVSFMNPPFNPGPNPYGLPPILLGALGPRMTRMVAEVADGLLVHPFSTERFVRERMLPTVAEGLASSGRTEDEFEITSNVIIATGRDERELRVAEAAVKALLAFYGSTPAYKPLLEFEGLGPLHTELFGLSKQGRWDDMAALVDDDVLDRFAVRAEPAAVGKEVARRFGDIAGRVGAYLPYQADTEVLAELAAGFSTG
jgi:probable F420-dependent oxidoreductase